MSKNLFESAFKRTLRKRIKELNENTLEEELGGGGDLGADDDLATQMANDVDAVDPEEARKQQDANDAIEIQDKIAQKLSRITRFFPIGLINSIHS